MKTLLHLLLLSVTLSAVAATGRPRTLIYRFDLHDPAHIHVALDLIAQGTDVILLPSQWAGQDKLYNAVSNLQVSTPGASLTPTANPARWLLRSRRSAPVTLTYDLAQDWSGPLKHPLEHRALLGPTLFEFNGENGLVVPLIASDDPVEASFYFDDLPPGQALVTSFGTDPIQHFAGPWSSIRNALFTGGQLATHTLRVEGEPVLLAMYGTWAFQPDEIAAEVGKILSVERRLWNDTHIPFYAIVVAPYEDSRSGGGGSGFTNLSTLFLADTRNFTADTASLLAHEAFHFWNPSGLGRVEDTQQIAWFGEGFSSFYQDTVLAHAGILTPAQYLARLNNTIKDYLLSPRINMPNADLQNTATSDHFSSEEPYLRGAMIAFWLSSEIDRQSAGRHTLTDLMLSLRAEHSQPLTADRIFNTAGRFVSSSTIAQLRSFALDGNDVPIPAGSLGECVAFNHRPAWTFHLGFDPTSLRKKGIVHGVEQGSNAYQAGVRDGQQLGGFSLWNGDAEREVTLTLRESDGSREKLSFLPRGDLRFIPQAQEIDGCPAGPRIPE